MWSETQAIRKILTAQSAGRATAGNCEYPLDAVGILEHLEVPDEVTHDEQDETMPVAAMNQLPADRAAEMLRVRSSLGVAGDKSYGPAPGGKDPARGPAP